MYRAYVLASANTASSSSITCPVPEKFFAVEQKKFERVVFILKSNGIEKLMKNGTEVFILGFDRVGLIII